MLKLSRRHFFTTAAAALATLAGLRPKSAQAAQAANRQAPSRQPPEAPPAPAAPAPSGRKRKRWIGHY